MKNKVAMGILVALLTVNCIVGVSTDAHSTYADEITVQPETQLQSPIAKCKIKTEKYAAYTGKPAKAVISVKNKNGDDLKENIDYTVTYTNNVNLGTATASINGIGKYTGTVTRSFVIHLAAPVLKSVKQTEFYENKITWNRVPGAAYYKIVYKTSEMSQYKALSKMVLDTSYEHVSTKSRPLKGGVDVYYKVIAVSDDGITGRYNVVPGSIRMKTARNGLLMEKGYYRYYENDVRQKSVWKTVNGKKYYFGSRGNADRNGSFPINGK